MIQIIAGTNRIPSQTLRVAKIFQKLYEKAGAKTGLLSLTDLPPAIFTAEAYSEKPADFKKFSDAVVNSSGLVIVTPEYNGGFPGVLKYFIDMLPFPASFEKRPVAFVGLAAGMWGALRSVEQLEALFRYRNAFLFNERIFLPRIEEQLTPQDTFVSPLVTKLVDLQVSGFIKFCQTLKIQTETP